MNDSIREFFAAVKATGNDEDIDKILHDMDYNNHKQKKEYINDLKAVHLKYIQKKEPRLTDKMIEH
jgi:hypothetical protein